MVKRKEKAGVLRPNIWMAKRCSGLRWVELNLNPHP